MENILVNGKMVKEKEKEYIIGMMENLKMIHQMEKEYIILIMVINMKENLKMV